MARETARAKPWERKHIQVPVQVVDVAEHGSPVHQFGGVRRLSVYIRKNLDA